MQPLISVIVPIYNVEPFLKKCVNSLLNQNSENYEIILVDDGSPDDSPRICDEFAQKDNKVKVIHKSNGGLVSARKAGINKATGEYIANVDGDDWVDPKFISTLTRIIENYSPEVIHFDSINVYGNYQEEIHFDLEAGFYDLKKIEKNIYPILIEDKFGRNFDPAICDNIFKREIYEKYQLNVNNKIKIGEDVACTKPIFSRIKSMYMCNECLYFYRINQLSMTKGKKIFPLNYPLLVGQELEKQFEISKGDFQMQIARWITHNLFVACSSSFYSNESYGIIRKKLKICLSNDYYVQAIKKCKYSPRYLKGNLAKFALKYRLYGLMKLYCKLALKS